MYLNQHPAAGIGEMVAGVNTGYGRRPTMGELVPGMFVMPQNPLMKSLAQVNGLPVPDIGGGYGEPGSVAGMGMGLGYPGMGAISDYLNTQTLIYAGLGVLALMVIGGAFGGGYYSGRRRGRGEGAGAGSGESMPTRLRITGSARAV